jgi:hypothetical protein
MIINNLSLFVFKMFLVSSSQFHNLLSVYCYLQKLAVCSMRCVAASNHLCKHVCSFRKPITSFKKNVCAYL